ncbi:MAG: hypothetical protein SCALA702_05360 [Melioribacteraceae bacterium]|nr:MAG: hypothetical protein SCALA702_05360 [Melioribacteraceae bacterium]
MKKIKLFILTLLISAGFLSGQTPTPSNGAANVLQTTASISWTAFDDGNGDGPYNVEFDDDAGFGSVDASASGTALLSLALPALTYGQTYHWRVADADTNGSGAQGPWHTFSFTVVTQLVPGAITTPTGTPYNHSLTPTITWNAASDGIAPYSYTANIYSNAGLTSLVHSSGAQAGTSYNVPAAVLANNTIYYVRISVTDQSTQSGNSGSEAFVTLLATPTLVSPIGGVETATTSPLLDWSMVGNTSNVEYEVFVSSDGGSNYTSLASGLSSTSYNSNLESSTEYTWYVTASVTSGSNTAKDASPDAFKTPLGLITPYNGLTGVSVEPILKWENANYDAGGYTVKISRDGANQAAFDANVYATQTTAQDDTSFKFIETHSSNNIPLVNDTLFYWQVIANDGVDDHYSEIYHFTTVDDVPTTLSWPADSATVYTDTTSLFWSINQPVGTMQFVVQVKAQSGEPTPVEWVTAEFVDTTTNTNTNFDLIGGDSYWWRVVVLNQDDLVIDYSDAWYFQTDGGAIVPNPSWPSGGYDVYTNQPTFYWYLNSPGTDLSYKMRYSTDSTFATYTESDTVTAMYWEVPSDLAAGTVYYWQVKSYYLLGTADEDSSDWSAKANFRTRGSGTLVVPVPSYPADSVIVYTSSPTLYWYLNDWGDGLVYDIDYATSLAGLGGALEVDDADSLYHTISGLNAGQIYYWRVRSDNGISTSAWSDTAYFVVDAGLQPGDPVASWPVGNPTLYTSQPTLNWYMDGSTTGLSYFTVRWKVDNPSANWNIDYSGEMDVNTDTTYYTMASALQYGKTYHWAVAAYDGSSYGPWSADTFTIVGGASAGAPVSSYPIGGESVWSEDVTLLWYMNASSTGIQGYQVVYSQSDVFANPVTVTVGPSGQTTQSLALTDLVPGAIYFWRVRAWYGGSTYTGWSNPESFMIMPGAGPNQPIVGGPTNNVLIGTNSPMISWVVAGQTSGITYELVLSEDPTFTNATVIENLTSKRASIPDLNKGSQYFWKVRSKDSDGNYSYYSGKGNFRIASVTDVKPEVTVIPDEYSLSQNYPNPFNPSTNIKYALPVEGMVSVKVYNMLGQEVKTLVNEVKNAGTYNLNWNGTDNFGSSIASGVYIVRIQANDFVMSRKMVLLK